jgi:serine/threonine protein kinase
MKRPSVEEFIATLLRSGLIEEAAWQRWYAPKAEQFDASEDLAQALVADNLITPWQNEKLLEGKSKNFFLGRYRILEQLGAGSMGAVFLAEHTVMRHRVALKVMAGRLQGSTRHIERFEREARATAAVNHPRIVRAFDVEMSGETPYLVMEYVEGDDLQKIVVRNGVLDVREAAEYIRQTAEGLHAAHLAGLVHRDIKPSNILLDRAGQIHILDLGLARLEAGDEASLTMMHNSRALGTVDYVAPEQARDSHSVDARADIYSLGCTLYFLLAGGPPFDEGTIPQRLLAHQNKKPPDVRLARPEIPDDLAKIYEKMLVKDPARRFQTAADVAAALQAFLRGEPPPMTQEDELIRINFGDTKAAPTPTPVVPAKPVTQPKPAQPANTAATVRAAVAATASSGSGNGPPSSATSLPPIAAPDPFGLEPAASGSSPLIPVQSPPGGSNPLLPLQSTSTPELPVLGGSDALMSSLSASLQPLRPSAAGTETVSELLGNTQAIPIKTLAPSPLIGPASFEPEGGKSLREMLLNLVAEEAKEGEGIGGFKYRLWFLILFGLLCGLILMGVAYSVMTTL